MQLAIGLFFALLSSVLSFRNEDLELLFVKQTLSLNSHIIREEHAMHMKNVGTTNIDYFDFMIRKERAPFLSYFVAYVELPDEKNPDKPQFHLLKQIEIDEDSLAALEQHTSLSMLVFRNQLPGYIPPDHVLAVRVLVVYSNMSRASPAAVPQGHNHQWIYEVDPVIVSPYFMREQETVIFVPKKNVVEIKSDISASKIQHLDDRIFIKTEELVPAFSEAPKIAIKYINNVPRLVIENLTRKVVISHWLQEIHIQENYDLLCDSPRLSQPFSRWQHSLALMDNDRVLPLTGLRMLLPMSAKGISYRDEVGNISTSHYSIIEERQRGLLELSPRFPLYGGYRSSFELFYRVPLSEYHTTGKTSHHLKIPTIEFFNDVIVKKFSLELCFPEHSKNIQPILPFTGRIDVAYEKSYLDWQGRPKLLFTGSNLIKEHQADFEVHYVYSVVDKLARPWILVAMFFVFFLLMFLYKKTSDRAKIHY